MIVDKDRWDQMFLRAKWIVQSMERELRSTKVNRAKLLRLRSQLRKAVAKLRQMGAA